jgi:hypothetical protein
MNFRQSVLMFVITVPLFHIKNAYTTEKSLDYSFTVKNSSEDSLDKEISLDLSSLFKSIMKDDVFDRENKTNMLIGKCKSLANYLSKKKPDKDVSAHVIFYAIFDEEDEKNKNLKQKFFFKIADSESEGNKFIKIKEEQRDLIRKINNLDNNQSVSIMIPERIGKLKDETTNKIYPYTISICSKGKEFYKHLWIDKKTLKSVLYQDDLWKVKLISFAVGRAFAKIHNQGIAHGDAHGNNFFINWKKAENEAKNIHDSLLKEPNLSDFDELKNWFEVSFIDTDSIHTTDNVGEFLVDILEANKIQFNKQSSIDRYLKGNLNFKFEDYKIYVLEPMLKAYVSCLNEETLKKLSKLIGDSAFITGANYVKFFERYLKSATGIFQDIPKKAIQGEILKGIQQEYRKRFDNGSLSKNFENQNILRRQNAVKKID